MLEQNRAATKCILRIITKKCDFNLKYIDAILPKHINSEEHSLLVHFLEIADLKQMPLLLKFWEMTVLFFI